MTARRLYLLRHAKSDWGNPELDDHDRPLNERGLRSANQVAVTLKKEKIAPDLVLVSTARRVHETVAPLELTVVEEPALYGASADELLAQVKSVPDKFTSVLLVGHNPGMEDLAASFGDENGMSTATLIAFDIDADTWANVAPGAAKPAKRWEHPGKK